MTVALDTCEELQSFIKHLQKRESTLAIELDEVRQALASAQTTIVLYSEWREVHPYQDPAEWNCSPDDIRDCESIRVALEVMARKNQGILRPSPAAKVLMQAGLTTSTNPTNASASIYARLKESPEWDHSESGTFKYLPYFTEKDLERAKTAVAETKRIQETFLP